MIDYTSKICNIQTLSEVRYLEKPKVKNREKTKALEECKVSIIDGFSERLTKPNHLADEHKSAH